MGHTLRIHLICRLTSPRVLFSQPDGLQWRTRDQEPSLHSGCRLRMPMRTLPWCTVKQVFSRSGFKSGRPQSLTLMGEKARPPVSSSYRFHSLQSWPVYSWEPAVGLEHVYTVWLM